MTRAHASTHFSGHRIRIDVDHERRERDCLKAMTNLSKRPRRPSGGAFASRTTKCSTGTCATLQRLNVRTRLPSDSLPIYPMRLQRGSDPIVIAGGGVLLMRLLMNRSYLMQLIRISIKTS